jgi:hypothetical protein
MVKWGRPMSRARPQARASAFRWSVSILLAIVDLLPTRLGAHASGRVYHTAHAHGVSTPPPVEQLLGVVVVEQTPGVTVCDCGVPVVWSRVVGLITGDGRELEQRFYLKGELVHVCRRARALLTQMGLSR